MDILWIPDDSTISSTIMLCHSTALVGEHDVRINGRRLVDPSEAYRADEVDTYDRANSRLRVSFNVLRDCEFAPGGNGAAYPDAEAAFLSIALHLGNTDFPGPSTIRGTGLLQFKLLGPATSATLQFNKAALESADFAKWDGVAITTQYVFVAASCTRV